MLFRPQNAFCVRHLFQMGKKRPPIVLIARDFTPDLDPQHFYRIPQTAEFKNNSSTLKHSRVAFFRRVCRVSKCHLKVINPLSVSVQSCGKKALNFRLEKVKFKHWRVGLDYFEKVTPFT